MSAAMLAAKKGREEQLELLEKFTDGETVVITTHQGKEYTADPTVEGEKLRHPRVPIKIKFSNLALLMHAAATSDADATEELLASGLDPNMANEDGLTALHQCCIENSLKVATILVDKGANVNARDKDWWTPLHAAAACGHWRIANFLISHGADVMAVNSDGDLPVDLADGDKTQSILTEEMRRLDIDDGKAEEARKAPEAKFDALVDELIAADFNLNAKDDQGICLLHVACSNAYMKAAKKLLDANADPNVQDPEGNTPLHLAVVFDHYRVVELLSKYAVDPTVGNRYNETPIVLTEDAMTIRLIKAIKTTEKLTSLTAEETGGSRRRLNSSIKRKTNTAKSGTKLAKLDAASEGKKIESNYAVIDFGGKSGGSQTIDEEDEKSASLKSSAPATTYASIDFNAKTGSVSGSKARQDSRLDYADIDFSKITPSDTAVKGEAPPATAYSQIDFSKKGSDSSPVPQTGTAAAVTSAVSPQKPKTFVVDVPPPSASSAQKKASLAAISVEETPKKPKGTCCTIS